MWFQFFLFTCTVFKKIIKTFKSMKFSYLELKKSFLSIGVLALLAVSCGGDPKTNTDNPEEIAEDTTTKTTTAGVLNINGQLFSIPSPVQTAMLIQKTGAAYDKSIMNPASNSNQYQTDFSKALNLGIYGADLGYVSMYSKTSDALSYLAHVKKLADELGVSGAFDENTMKRINNNIGNKDSMLALVGVAYRSSDAFLKDNARNDVSGLILTGGWIESLNFAIIVNQQKANADLKRRIAEQKQSLNSIIKLLIQFESKTEFTTLLSDLKDLAKVYDGIEFKYVYEKPVTDIAAKTTTINSRTDVNVSDDQISQIATKVKALREKLINPSKA